ncbi:MAG: carbohydrate-binding protein, partial [Planctomycetes bacterium]|nr:carbohydrate-binding protein [Planctomycetota bacterium]
DEDETTGDNPVVWVNTALRPIGDFVVPSNLKTDAVDEKKSLAALSTDPTLVAQGLGAPAALARFSAPKPTVFAGVGPDVAAPRLAVEYTAHDADGPASWSFVADAKTGDILHVQSNLHYNIDGTVQAEVIAGVEAMECGTLVVEGLPHAHVTSAVGSAVTDATGAFSIPESGSGTVSVTSNLIGEFFEVGDTNGSPASITLNVSPPGPANFLHQDPTSPPELVLAQLNAYKQVNALRDLLITHVPDYPVISGELGFEVNVNATGDTPMDLCARTGGAWYDNDHFPRSINFCQKTTSRANTAMGSIVHHEYGHHIIDSGGSRQSEYGEGMADTIAMLFSGNPAMGLGYNLDCSEPLRYSNRDCQYSATDCSSCGSGIYECGALISSAIWDVWQQLKNTDPTNADDIIRSLVFSSIPMHTGSSIEPSIGIDLLTLDDDDGLLENGTPHYQEICTGFGLHNMDCPPIVDGLVVHGEELAAGGPSDGPFEPASLSYTLHNLGPQENLSYSVQIPPEATWLTVDAPTGTIPFGSETTVTVSIDQAAAAALSDGRYVADIDFINVDSNVGNVSRQASLRVGVPEPIYTATFDDGLDGFVVDDSDYDNIWHQTTTCVDTLPGHSSPGSLYYGRDDQCSHSTSVPNRHWVTSPTIPIANPAVVDLGFNYYFWTERPGSDFVEVLMSVDGGPFEIVASEEGEGGHYLEQSKFWKELRFEISELLPSSGPTSIQLQFAFDAGSPGDNYETGFLVDDVTVYAGSGSSGAVNLPARIEAEDYVRYNDTTPGNQGGGCDTGDDVDKEITGDSAGGGCNVGWTEAGEWLEYDVSVATAQTFDIITRAATANAGKSFHIEVDGVDVSGALGVPANGW